MKIRMIRLDGKEKYFTANNRSHTKPESKLHYEARKVIKQAYNNIILYEEVPVIHRPNGKIIFDFFIPLFRTFVEVQGEQHFKFNTHFFKSKAHFLHAQRLDKEKEEWCLLNNFPLIHFNYNESLTVWKKKLLN